MSNPDRPTPPEPHRAARVPRPSPRASADDPQAVRDAESLERRLREEQRRKRPPVVDPTPIRDRRPEPDRSRTPESGGIEAQRETVNVVVSEPPKSADIDRTIGKLVRLLVRRYGFQGVLTVGVAAAVLKPAAAPQKVEDTKAQVESLKRERDTDRELIDGLVKREARRDRYEQCMQDEITEMGEQVLPAPDRMGSARPPRPFVERCSRLKP